MSFSETNGKIESLRREIEDIKRDQIEILGGKIHYSNGKFLSSQNGLSEQNGDDRANSHWIWK